MATSTSLAARPISSESSDRRARRDDARDQQLVETDHPQSEFDRNGESRRLAEDDAIRHGEAGHFLTERGIWRESYNVRDRRSHRRPAQTTRSRPRQATLPASSVRP